MCTTELIHVSLLQFRAFMDGPQGMLAESLHLLGLTLPPELAEAFSYFSQAGASKSGRGSSNRRSRKSVAGASVISPASSTSGIGDVEKTGLRDAAEDADPA
eukprot:jgi/Ulvmu1/8199/UM041_0008.1